MKKTKLSNSLQLLYTVFVLTIINLGYFILYKDTQSLFLFVCISAVVYLIQCNMVYSLLYPLIIVNGLNLLQKVMNVKHTEGFKTPDDLKFTKKEKNIMLKWIQDNLEDESMTEYVNYSTSIDDNLLPLSTILDNISVTQFQERNSDYEDINEFIRYVKKINTMDDADESELSFVNNMVEKIMDVLPERNEEEQELELENEKNNKEEQAKELELEENDEETNFNNEDKIEVETETFANLIKDTISQKQTELFDLKNKLKNL